MLKVSLCAAIVFALGFASTSNAATVSAQFAGDNYWEGLALTSGETAGVQPATNWNVIGSSFVYGSDGLNANNTTYTTPANSLVDSTSAVATGLGYSLNYNGGFAQDGYSNNNLPHSAGDPQNAGNPANTPDYKLLTGSAQTAKNQTPVTLTLTGLSAATTYDLYVYTSGSAYQLSVGSVSVSGSSTRYFVSGQGDGANPGITALQNNSAASAPPTGDYGAAVAMEGNYVLFTGLTGATSRTITMTNLGKYDGGTGGVLGLAGFQLVSTGVPEPTGLGALALGMIPLLRRKPIVSTR